ncbi:SUMF1/EgtB/PvdO family nonheme iron enzyme [Chloroflexi bacterium TSY]|nr:SUMF1/EgtB/PvdO family nonheme iron enzyme [Chloroflexi bacterium TSY]
MIDASEYVNSLGMKFTHIPAGSYMMGTDPRAMTTRLALHKFRINGDVDEFPRHKVNIAQAFHMGIHQVTNAQYEQFDPDHRTLRGKVGFSKADDEAVVNVSWHDAVAFCEWLSAKENLPYRLPTEAEWEYACRAGTDTLFHTGDELPAVFHKNQHNSWYPDASRPWNKEEEIVGLHVGQTPPNAWGLYDMHGNVEEWCIDWYGPYMLHEQHDPVGYTTGECQVTRGGSHSTDLYYLRSANRSGTLPDDSSWLIGFRVVLGELSSAPQLTQKPRSFQVDVVQARLNLTAGPDSATPYFHEPRTFVKVPPGMTGPMFAEHNHLPSIVECPNGDLLAVWFSCISERDRELTLAASRLRHGNDEWDPASPYWDAPDRNMTGSVLWRNGDAIHLFGAMSAAGTWGHNIIYQRTSNDSGATWSSPRIIVPDHATGQVLPINLVFRMADGTVVLPCDDAAQNATKLYFSDDNGVSWADKAGRIDGIHAGVAQLHDGRLLGLGRRLRGDIDPAMPQSISSDGGETFVRTASIFDAISGGQRPVLLRLQEGPLAFFSFTPGMEFTDKDGAVGEQSWTGRGLFGALSYDEGETWPVRRLITDDQPDHWLDGGAWTGKFIMSPTLTEPRGYLTATQAANGIIHLLSSKIHYAFNLAWLKMLAD